MRGRKFILFLGLFLFGRSQLSAQTNGTLIATVTTAQTATGTFAPRNILAIWIEDNSGKFVKTLLAYANTRITYLNAWEAATTAVGSVYNRVDAITGATQSSHGTRTCRWNGTDYSGKAVADGTYKLRMELTDQNASGNSATFTFTKGSTSQKLTPADVLPSFKSISINWSVVVTDAGVSLTQSNTVAISPNPGTGFFKVLAERISKVEVFSVSGEKVLTCVTPFFDLSNQPNGFYLVRLSSGSDVVIRKILKNNP